MAKLLGSSVVVALVASVYAQTNFSACPVIPDGYKFTDPSRKCSSVSPAIADTGHNTSFARPTPHAPPPHSFSVCG